MVQIEVSRAEQDLISGLKAVIRLVSIVKELHDSLHLLQKVFALL
jgi:hypothetical protein